MNASKSPVTVKTQKTFRNMRNSRTPASGGRESQPVSQLLWKKEQTNKQNIHSMVYSLGDVTSLMSRLRCYLPTKVEHCLLAGLSCACRNAYATCASA